MSRPELPPAVVRDVAQRRYRIAKGIAITMAVLALLVGGAMLLVLSLEARDTSANVESCLVPGGDCYERGERRRLQDAETQELVRDIKVLLCNEQPTADICLQQP